MISVTGIRNLILKRRMLKQSHRKKLSFTERLISLVLIILSLFKLEFILKGIRCDIICRLNSVNI